MAKETPQERLARFEKANLCFFWVPYPWQERALQVVREKTTTPVISSNKIGKTAFVVNVLNS